MASCTRLPIIAILVSFLALLLLTSSISPVLSLPSNAHNSSTFNPQKELHMYRKINAQLNKTNKPSLKQIQSPDGDIIDCVASHLQPAFDHPKLKGQRPLGAPEMPKSNETLMEEEMGDNNFQWWSDSGEFCPEGTVPIRRTTVKDVLRASSIERFGRKSLRTVKRDSSSNGHDHAVGYVSGAQYYGAKASLNVWSPRVTTPSEFSRSQIWVISGSFGGDLNTIEAGWQSDAYQETGCYKLLCSGFVQTNNKIAIGAAISPRSAYNGGQFDISLLMWKDQKHGHWWLQFGSGLLIGYWPSFLFNHLTRHASMVQFGGEIVNSRPSGFHTSTQMGSVYFACEGFRRAAYCRNLQVVDWDNNLLPLSNIRLLADHSNCSLIRTLKL